MNDDFYIGWEDRVPPAYARPTRQLVVGIVSLVLLSGLGFAAAQRLIGVAFFEWGNVKEFTGTLHVDPYPHLIIHADATNARVQFIAAPLVAPFKFGVKREDVAEFDGKPVTLRGTRIYRDRQLMLEVEPKSMKFSDASVGSVKADAVSLGRQTFRGEIVDSKCWMGVMNPGVLKPHRACAVRCISGGIPAMLLVRRQGVAPLNLLLVSSDNRPVNDAVLDFVAEPVEITGEVVRQGELLTLRADPATYRRIGR